MPPEFFFYALLTDIVLGEPGFLPHPVQAVGLAVERIKRYFMSAVHDASGRRFAGAVMAASVALAAFAISYLAIKISYALLGVWGGGAVTVYLAYTTISIKGMADAAGAVGRPLKKGDIGAARGALSMIVGRDTAGLEASEIARGAVETVSENASDGVVAPLFYMALGGVPLAMAYKAVNTMDSMVGYRSDEYKDFGWAPARLDDAANFLPARLTALFMLISSFGLQALYPGRFDGARAWRVLLRDRRNHPSPNSGHPEAAAAGSLGVRLGGECSYFGRPGMKPYIGEPEKELGPGTINDSVRLLLAASVLAVAFSALLSYLVAR